MRIKRFIAPDMRTALRMVREEQGPDAVILSNRPAEGGIEIVAATDYDEALVQQALRTAAVPMAEPVAAQKPASVVVPIATARQHVTEPAGAMPQDIAARNGRADAMIAALTRPVAAPTPERVAVAHEESTVTRPQAPAPVQATAPVPAQKSTPGDDFRAMLARLTGAEQAPVPEPVTPAPDAPAPATPEVAEQPADSHAAPTRESEPHFVEPAPAPVLRAVSAEDPMLVAMRGELAAMRQLMEQQMGELALERLRGSPARAAVLDALTGYGCEESLAQAVATRIDPRMDPAQARTAMLDELARMITINRAEPIDDGGVIALVGPTGAGKTTTVAKLAARFAARHRARDVALVTTDTERAGAREQLHAHGRRLGITVCEAEGPEALNATLAQLVDYPLVLVDTAGYAARDRALLGQILWLRTARRVRSLLVLPANANPHDLTEVARRYRPASPEGVVLTKTDETGRLGAAVSVLVKQNLSLAYTCGGQQLPDLDAADPARLVTALEKLRRAADNPLATEDRHAVA